MAACVGDDERGLGGEHDQGLLAQGGERPAVLGFADVYATHALAAADDRHGQEGRDRADGHGRAEFGQAHGPGVVVEVAQPQWLRNAVQVLEEAQAVGQLREEPVFLRCQAGGDEVLDPPRIIQQCDHAVAGAGQGASAVQHPLKYCLEVQAFVDAQAGLAQLGETVAQGSDLLLKMLVLWHDFFTMIEGRLNCSG